MVSRLRSLLGLQRFNTSLIVAETFVCGDMLSNKKYYEDNPAITAEILTSFHIPTGNDEFSKCVETLRNYHVNFR